MPGKSIAKTQGYLFERVVNNGICTGCGACANLCPYIVSYRDQMILIDQCDREEGRCYAYCPRTPTNLDAIRQELFYADDLTEELGPFRGLYMTRASDEKVRSSAQHGGTVTTLLTLALEEGLIDCAVVSEVEGSHLAQGVVATDRSEILKGARSKFVASPVIAAFNAVGSKKGERIGIVATPCQALSLAKMRSRPFPKDEQRIENLRLVIGLFCGWALSWRSFRRFLVEKRIDEETVIGLDVPPSKYRAMEVQTRNEIISIPLEEVMPCIKEACKYCCDMTGEFTDLSVGSARCPEGWEIARSWNQVIVRTEIGGQLLDLARSRGVLEFREVPQGNLEKLRKASMNKKRFAIQNLIQKSGSVEDLIYMDCHDPVLRKLLRTPEEQGSPLLTQH